MMQCSSRAHGSTPTTATASTSSATDSQGVSRSRPSTPPLPKRALMTTAQVQSILNKPDLGIYIGKSGLPGTVLFFLDGPNGDTLISSATQEELILHCVF